MKFKLIKPDYRLRAKFDIMYAEAFNIDLKIETLEELDQILLLLEEKDKKNIIFICGDKECDYETIFENRAFGDDPRQSLKNKENECDSSI